MSDFRAVGLVFALLVILSACQGGAGGNVGSGPMTLSDEVYDAYQRYLENDPLVFAISDDGRDAFYYYCREVGCQPLRNVPDAIARCEERSGRDCKVFAIRDQVVWENAGEWRPYGAARTEALVGASDADLSAVAGTLSRVLENDPIFGRYSAAPGHRAFVVAVDPRTGKIIRRGYTFAYGSLETAIQAAGRFCRANAVGAVRDACRVYDVNGEVFWPTVPDKLTPDQLNRAAEAGAAMAPYEGLRRAAVEWADVGDEDVIAAYTLDKGFFTFEVDFEGENFPGPCVGKGDARKTNGLLQFTMSCADGTTVLGSGTYTNNLRKVSLTGTDSKLRSIDIRIEQDHLLPGG